MDTYFSANGNCVKCGRCTKICQEKGEQFLGGGRGIGPVELYDYVPCHHCEGHCLNVCHYGAIKIERW